MSDDESLFNRELEENGTAELMRRITKNPFLTVGIGGFVTLVTIGAYKFKNRPVGMTATLYFTQLRVIAQSFIIGSLMIGATWNMLDRWVINPKKRTEIKSQ